MAEKYSGTMDEKSIMNLNWGGDSDYEALTGAQVQSGLKAAISKKVGYSTIYKKYVYTFASQEDYLTWLDEGASNQSSLIISRSDAIKLSEISKTGSLTITYDELDLIVSGTTCSISNLIFKGTYFDDNDKEQQIPEETNIKYSITAQSSSTTQKVIEGYTRPGVKLDVNVYKFLIDNEAVSFIIEASYQMNGQTISNVESTVGLVKSNLSVTFADPNFWKSPIDLSSAENYNQLSLKIIGGEKLNIVFKLFNIQTGVAVVTLNKEMSGDPTSSQPFLINPAVDLSGIPHGVYRALVYATLTMGKVTVESAKISKNMMLITSTNDTDNFICANLASESYTNYTSPQVLRFIYWTNSDTTSPTHIKSITGQIVEPVTGLATAANEIALQAMGNELYTYSTNISLNTKNNPITSVVTLSANLTNDTQVLLFSETFRIDNTVQFNAADPVSSVLEFDMDPSIQNAEQDVKNSAYKSSDANYRVPTTWTNLIWGDNEGWITDTSTNQSILKLSNGSKMQLNNNLFSTASADGAITFEIMYKVENTLDADEPVVQCFLQTDALFRGLKIYPELVDFRASTTKYSDLETLRICDGEIIHLTIVCYPNYYGWGFPITKLYINGKIAREIKSSLNRFNAPLIIGSDTADISVYKIRKYNSAFNEAKVLANYLNCMTDAEKRIKVNTDNQIYSSVADTGDNNTGILFENVKKEGSRALFNCFVLSSETSKPGDLPNPADGASASDNCVLPRMGDKDKKWCPDARIELYWDGNDYKDNEDVVIQLNNADAALQYQGSSSAKYFRYNWRTKFTKGCTVTHEDGSVKANEKLTFKGPVGSVKVSILTAKKNYASSMQTHKLGNCLGYQAVYNYLINNYSGTSGAGETKLKDSLASQVMIDKDYKAYVATWQAPFLGFVKVKQADGSYIYRYVGLYTVGPDKGDKQMTGFDVDKYPNFFEVEGANQSPRFVNFAVPWRQDYIEHENELLWYNKGKNNEPNSTDESWEIIKFGKEGAVTSEDDDTFGSDTAINISDDIVRVSKTVSAGDEENPDATTEVQVIDIVETFKAVLAKYPDFLNYIDAHFPELLIVDEHVNPKIEGESVIYKDGTFTHTTTINEDGEIETKIIEIDDDKNYYNEFKRRFENLYRFVFRNSINIHPYDGSVEDLMKVDNNLTKLDPYFAYWSVQDPEYKLYLYDSHVNHYDVIRQDGDTEDMNVKALAQAAIASGISATDYEAINKYIIDQRAASFKAGWTNYFHDRDTMIWYTNVLLNAGTDERAKNIYPYFVGTDNDNKMRWRIDDTDTRQDVDNEGKPIKKYWIELGDDMSLSGVTWETASVLFNLLGHDVFFEERREAFYNTFRAMIQLTNSSGDNADSIIKFYDKYFFDTTANYFPEQAYNKDAYFCYDQAEYYKMRGGSIEANVAPLTQSLGDHRLGDRSFMRDRINYLLSKYTLMSWGVGGSELISLPRRFHTVKPFDIKYNKWVYVLRGQGDEIENTGVRLKKGDTYSMSINVDDTNSALDGKSVISDFGDLSGVYINQDTLHGGNVSGTESIDPISFSNLNLLQNIKTGGPGTHFNTNLTCEQCPNLRTLDIRNCTGIVGKKNVLGSTHIEKVLANNTNIEGVLIANGAPVDELQLPRSAQEIYINNLSKLTADNFSIGGVAFSDKTNPDYQNVFKNVERILVRNTNGSESSVDGLELLLTVLDSQKALSESLPDYEPTLKYFNIDGFNTVFRDEDADTKLSILSTISKNYKGYSITQDGYGNPYYNVDTSTDCKMSGNIIVRAFYRQNDFVTLKLNISNSSNLSVIADGNYDSIINFKDAEFQRRLYQFIVSENSSFSNYEGGGTKVNWYENIESYDLNKMKALCNTNDGTINDRNGNVIVSSILKKNVIPFLGGSTYQNSSMIAAMKGQSSQPVSGLTDLSDWGTWFPDSYPLFLGGHDCTGLDLDIKYTTASRFPLSSVVSSSGSIGTLNVSSTGKLTIAGSANSQLTAENVKFSATGIMSFDNTTMLTFTNVDNLYINSEAGLPDYSQGNANDLNPARIRNIYVNAALYWSYIGSNAGWATRITRFGDKFIPYNFITNRVTEVPVNPNQVLNDDAIFFNQSAVVLKDNEQIRFFTTSVFEVQFNTSIARPYGTNYFYVCGTNAARVYIDGNGKINFFTRTGSMGTTQGRTATSSKITVNTTDTYTVTCDIRNGAMTVSNGVVTEKVTPTGTAGSVQADSYPICLGTYNDFVNGASATYDQVSDVKIVSSPFMGNIFYFKLYNGGRYDNGEAPTNFLKPMTNDAGEVYFRDDMSATSTDKFNDIKVRVSGDSANTLQFNNKTV